MLSARRRRGGTPNRGSPARGHRSPHQEAKARTAVRRVFHVAGAQPAHSSAKTAAARVEVSDRTITTYSFDERPEGLAVSTTSRRGEVTAGEERLHRCGHRRHMTHRMIRLRCCRWGETNNTTHSPEYRPPI